MSIFVTGATGYLGSYVVAGLLREHSDRLALLVRAGSPAEARQRLWNALQLHMEFDEFWERLCSRVDIYLGDLTSPGLGLARGQHARLVEDMDSVIHVAASLNRKSARSCLNVNLRGTLEVLKLARAAHDRHGLRRFSDVSTTAVAGKRHAETVDEGSALEWGRSDYDPYARTKKFCEHMVHELLPDVPRAIFRPSIVLGDSRFAETTQFDMVRAFAILAQAPVLPFARQWRLDIVPADFVGRAIVTIHQRPQPAYTTYHLSAGEDSRTYGQLVDALWASGHKVPHVFLPGLQPSVARLVDVVSNTPREWGAALPASLFKVFMPYLAFDTVFANQRVVEELGERPTPFEQYSYPLLRFALDGGFRYPYRPWPAEVQAS